MTEGLPEGGKSGGLLRRKVFGKVPLVYVLAGLVVILVIVAWRMKGGAPHDATGEADTSGGDDGDGTDASNLTDGVDNVTDSGTAGAPTLAGGAATSYGGFLANSNSGTGAVDPTTQTIVAKRYQTNDEWVRAGVEWGGTHGYKPGSVQTALQHYVDGEPLAYWEGEIRDAAIRQNGAPPEAFNAGGTGKKPTDVARKQGNPPCQHIVKGRQDNTFYLLANLYYSHPTGPKLIDAMNQLRRANPGALASAAYFDVGAKVQIPAFKVARFYTSTATIDTAAEIAKKNGLTTTELGNLNPTLKFPVKAGTRVQVG